MTSERARRNVSIALNVALAVALGVSLAFGWKANRDGERSRDSARETRALVALYEKFIKARNLADAYLGMRIPRMQLSDVGGQVVSTDLRGGAGGLFLVFSPERTCQHCLATLLKTLQHVHRALVDPTQLPIVAISSAGQEETRRFQTAFELDYPLVSDSARVLLDEELTRITPLVLLADQSGTVISAHTTSSNEPSFSILFFYQLLAWQVRGHLKVMVDSQGDLGLGGVPVLSVIRGEYDDGSVAHLLY